MKVHMLLTIVSVSVMSQSLAAESKTPQPVKPRPEHEFLKRFVGEWIRTTETPFRPGKSVTTKGTMTGQMIGNFWVVIDRKSDIGKNTYHGRATYGFDSRKRSMSEPGRIPWRRSCGVMKAKPMTTVWRSIPKALIPTCRVITNSATHGNSRLLMRSY